MSARFERLHLSDAASADALVCVGEPATSLLPLLLAVGPACPRVLLASACASCEEHCRLEELGPEARGRVSAARDQRAAVRAECGLRGGLALGSAWNFRDVWVSGDEAATCAALVEALGGEAAAAAGTAASAGAAGASEAEGAAVGREPTRDAPTGARAPAAMPAAPPRSPGQAGASEGGAGAAASGPHAEALEAEARAVVQRIMDGRGSVSPEAVLNDLVVRSADTDDRAMAAGHHASGDGPVGPQAKDWPKPARLAGGVYEPAATSVAALLWASRADPSAAAAGGGGGLDLEAEAMRDLGLLDDDVVAGDV